MLADQRSAGDELLRGPVRDRDSTAKKALASREFAPYRPIRSYERPTGWRHSGCPRTDDGGGRYPSVVGFRVLDVQPIEELLSCPFGPQHVKGRVLPVLRNDFVFAFGL